MNDLQKSAWWTLIWTILASAAVAIAWPWLGFGAAGFFGLFGFIGFGALFLRRPGFHAVLDERDRVIATSARDLSMRLVYLFFIAGFIAIMFAFGGDPRYPLNGSIWCSA